MLEVYTEALTRFSHIHRRADLNTTLLSQGCFLENISAVGPTGMTIHPVAGRAEEPLTAQVQLEGQPVVMSSQDRPPTTLPI